MISTDRDHEPVLLQVCMRGAEIGLVARFLQMQTCCDYCLFLRRTRRPFSVSGYAFGRKNARPDQQGGGMRAAFMSIEEAVVTYLEGVTLASQNAELGDSGACRRR